MERYLKEEPKLSNGCKKLPADLDTPWDLFAPPGSPLTGSWKMEVNPLCIDKLNLEQNIDSLSTTSSSSSCSHLSWDACAVVVKNEPIDTDEYDENSDSYEEGYSIDNPIGGVKYNSKGRQSIVQPQNAIGFTLVTRSQLPTPPSSPEPNSLKLDIQSKLLADTNIKDRKAVIRMTSNSNSGHLSRNAIVRLTSGTSKIGLARLIHVNPKIHTTSTEKIVNVTNPPCMYLKF